MPIDIVFQRFFTVWAGSVLLGVIVLQAILAPSGGLNIITAIRSLPYPGRCPGLIPLCFSQNNQTKSILYRLLIRPQPEYINGYESNITGFVQMCIYNQNDSRYYGCWITMLPMNESFFSQGIVYNITVTSGKYTDSIIVKMPSDPKTFRVFSEHFQYWFVPEEEFHNAY